MGERVTSKSEAKAKRNQTGNLNAGETTKTALPGSPPPAPNERCRWWGARQGGRQKMKMKRVGDKSKKINRVS